jgi:hypothetical protein
MLIDMERILLLENDVGALHIRNNRGLQELGERIEMLVPPEMLQENVQRYNQKLIYALPVLHKELLFEAG